MKEMNILKRFMKDTDKTIQIHILVSVVGATTGILIGWLVNRAANTSLEELVEDNYAEES